MAEFNISWQVFMLNSEWFVYIEDRLFFLEQYLSVTVTRRSILSAEFMCSPGKNFREKLKITPSNFDWLVVISNSYGGRQCHTNVWPTLEVVWNQPPSELYLCNEQLLKITRKEATLWGVSGTHALPLCLLVSLRTPGLIPILTSVSSDTKYMFTVIVI